MNIYFLYFYAGLRIEPSTLHLGLCILSSSCCSGRTAHALKSNWFIHVLDPTLSHLLAIVSFLFYKILFVPHSLLGATLISLFFFTAKHWQFVNINYNFSPIFPQIYSLQVFATTVDTYFFVDVTDDLHVKSTDSFSALVLLFFFGVLRIRALHVLGNCSTTELHTALFQLGSSLTHE